MKNFIPARRDPSFVLPGSHFAWTKFSHVIAPAHLSGTNKLINTSVEKILKPVSYQTIFIIQLVLFNLFDSVK